MKAHTYYIIFGRPPIGGEASRLPPLAAPLPVTELCHVFELCTADDREWIFTLPFPLMQLIPVPFRSQFPLSLQCFDAVGWAAGRASGL